jgi:hypothetical protein
MRDEFENEINQDNDKKKNMAIKIMRIKSGIELNKIKLNNSR